MTRLVSLILRVRTLTVCVEKQVTRNKRMIILTWEVRHYTRGPKEMRDYKDIPLMIAQGRIRTNGVKDFYTQAIS